MKTPFQIADRYIVLHKQCMSPSWGDAMIRLNEMVLGPMIVLFMAFLGKGDLFGVVSAAMTAHRSWSEWLEYDGLRFDVQNMYLKTMAMGGPFIRTNDPTYQAYVYADAVMRDMLRRGSA